MWNIINPQFHVEHHQYNDYLVEYFLALWITLKKSGLLILTYPDNGTHWIRDLCPIDAVIYYQIGLYTNLIS